jgi:hypothetical protein
MSKRFHDTDIWDEDWYLDMPLEYRSFWGYVCDKCDHAGIWRPNVRRFNADIENKIDLDTALQYFNTDKERIVPLESGHWMIAEFVPFQYGKNLNLNNRVHLSVFNRLKDLEVNLGSIRGLNEVKMGSSRPQVEVKEGVKDKDKDIDIIVLLKKRMTSFKDDIMINDNNYPKEMLAKFFDYWSEPNRSNTKMRFELEKTWSLPRRLKTWADRDLDGDVRKKNGSVADFKMDAVGRAAIGWCSKCGKSDFYEPKTIKTDDSKCCNALLVPSKPPVEEKFQATEIY